MKRILALRNRPAAMMPTAAFIHPTIESESNDQDAGNQLAFDQPAIATAPDHNIAH
jgi:hypothetical protein